MHRFNRMTTNFLCIATLCIICYAPNCNGFTPPSSSAFSKLPLSSLMTSSPSGKRSLPSSTRVYSSNNNNQGNAFDISKPTFDLLSFRLIRSDALLRYNSLNQSEPLRINLFLLATVSLLGYPLWCESVTGDVATLPSTAGSIAAGMGTAALFWRERSRRSNQLYRMEKELNAGELEIRLPVNKAISSALGMAVRLRDLRSKRRIVAIRGTKEQLSSKGVWDTLSTLRRRLIQSQTLVVLVPTDGSTKKDWAGEGDATTMWLADPLNVDGQDGWVEYFDELLGANEEDGNQNKKDGELAWFALNFKGRSIASGMGEAPRVLELLGQQLQPMELLDEDDKAEVRDDVPAVNQILEAQKNFYKVLTDSDDQNEMTPIFTSQSAEEVDEVLNGGGRIDDWSKCLEPDARPAGMVISGSDAWISSSTRAYSTCIEFPPNAGMDGATLLAVQRWGRESEDGEWKLELHQTIPWSVGSRAGGTLRCDCRGCVALARAPDKRTFGGLIG